MTPSGELRRQVVDPHPARMDERPRAPHASSDVPVTLGVAAAHAIGRSAPTATDPAAATAGHVTAGALGALDGPLRARRTPRHLARSGLLALAGAALLLVGSTVTATIAAAAEPNFPAKDSALSQLRRDGRRDPGRGGGAPGHRPRVQHRQDLRGARPLGGQDHRQRRRRRGRARGAVRRPPARPRAPDGRDGALPAHSCSPTSYGDRPADHGTW